MRQRPLCSVCLAVVICMCVMIQFGGAKVVKELRPSALEIHVEAGRDIKVTGQVYKKEIKEKYQVLYLKNNSIYYQKQSIKESKIIIYDEAKTEIHIGDQVQASGRLSLFSVPRNPGNFDQKMYYQKYNIHGSVWAKSVKILKPGQIGVGEWLYSFRQKWKQVFERLAGKEEGAVLAAMILGEKADMDAEMKELYQRGGIGHVIAISGVKMLSLVSP